MCRDVSVECNPRPARHNNPMEADRVRDGRSLRDTPQATTHTSEYYMPSGQLSTLPRLGLIAGALVLMPAAANAQQMGAKPEGKEVTVTGVVVDVSCKFGQGLTGAEHRMCAQVCADRGIPLAILTDDGTLYIPASAAMPGEGQNARLKEFAEQRVTVRGKAFKAGGAQALQIATIQRS